MKRTHRDLIHGTQQHPHVTKIATNTATDINTDMIKFCHFPNVSPIQSVIGLETPEFSCISRDRVRSPFSALVTLPSGTVLFGMYVQHKSPNMAHTLPLSASNISRAIRFCTAIREVGASCSARPSTASLVRLASLNTL